MIIERILKYPGFLYELKGSHYFLGKWICKECTDTDAADCMFMYRMNRNAKENTETNGAMAKNTVWITECGAALPRHSTQNYCRAIH